MRVWKWGIAMSEKPLVSVVMPIYNAERYVEEALSSIINQTYKNLEIIIVNDCSSDSSMRIIGQMDDPRIIIINNKTNLGVAASLNRGFMEARGNYIARMDSDDIAELDRISLQVNYMEENPNVVVCGTAIRFIGNKKGTRIFQNQYKRILVDLMFQCALCHPTVMLRRKILIDNGLNYEEDFEKAEDYRLWTRCSQYGAIGNIEDVGLNYRVHDSQVSNVYKKKQDKASDIIRKEYLEAYKVYLSEKEVSVFNKMCNNNRINTLEISLCLSLIKKIIRSLKDNNNFDTLYMIYALSGLLNKAYYNVDWMMTKKCKKAILTIYIKVFYVTSIVLYKAIDIIQDKYISVKK